MKTSGLLLVAALGMAPVLAQNAAPDHPEQYAPADVTAGAHIYNATCVTCHGVSGTGVGGIDLRHGLLPRARTDAALQAVIATGFPQSGMPAFHLDSNDVRALVAFIRSGLDTGEDAAPVTLGDPARGRALVEGKGTCLSCHRINEHGQFSGPDLTDIGRARTPAAIRRSLMDPTGSMRPINRPVKAVTRDGGVVTGRRLNEDTYSVQLITDQGRLVSLVKSDLREWSVGATSPMPSYKDALATGELADVLAYLVSLKG
jgi:putative heme-binding domain-containing protein